MLGEGTRLPVDCQGESVVSCREAGVDAVLANRVGSHPPDSLTGNTEDQQFAIADHQSGTSLCIRHYQSHRDDEDYLQFKIV